MAKITRRVNISSQNGCPEKYSAGGSTASSKTRVDDIQNRLADFGLFCGGLLESAGIVLGLPTQWWKQSLRSERKDNCH